MRSQLRYTLLLASALVACGGIPGCSGEPENNAGKMELGKMSGSVDKMEPGKMDKMEPGKMSGPMDKPDSGKMSGPMDKMEKGKME
jgi:hypothetical protein